MSKKMMLRILGILGLLGCESLLKAFNVWAADLYVPSPQYGAIQAAINAAANGDTVVVNDGTYTENINFNGKAITVQSVNGPESTIIDGNASGTVVTFNSGEGTGSVLSGFTIRNGNATNGGGIYCSDSSPLLCSLNYPTVGIQSEMTYPLSKAGL